MTITALLFASYADVLGASELTLDMANGATVRDALAVLRSRQGGELLPEEPLVAVNLDYASAGRVLRDGDELAVIPPVAGG